MIQESIASFLEKNKAAVTSNVPVRVIIAGLAYCKLSTGQSEINFLRHVPNHDLEIIIFRTNLTTGTEEPILTYRVPINHTISLTPDHPVQPASIIAHAATGEYPLTELLNLSTLHGAKVVEQTSLSGIKKPTPLFLSGCTFYTASITKHSFQIIELNNAKPIPGTPSEKRIGYIMGGKITYQDSDGNTTLVVDGSLGFELNLPQFDEIDNEKFEYVYDVIFFNHCTEQEEVCKSLLGNQSDFRFYYNVLVDSATASKTFQLVGIPGSSSGEDMSGVGVEACNVVIIDPPTTPPS